MTRGTPDWFYPDDLEFEAGMTNVQVYTSQDEEEAGRLFLTLDGGGGEVTADMTYEEVFALWYYLRDWIDWAEASGYGG